MKTYNVTVDYSLSLEQMICAGKYDHVFDGITSDEIIRTGKKTAKIHGMLTVRGITKPITLDATLNKAGENPISNKMSVGFSAVTQLKRSEFNINTLLPGLGDDVKINIELEAYKKTP